MAEEKKAATVSICEGCQNDDAYETGRNACLALHADCLEALGQQGFDFSSTDRRGNTLVFWAVQTGNSDLVLDLSASRGIDLTAVNADGNSAIFWAARSGWVELVDTVLQKHPDEAQRTNNKGWNLGHFASEYLDCKESPNYDAAAMIAALAKAGVDFNHQNNVGDTPAHQAVEWGTDGNATCEALKEHGADITIENAAGQTPAEKGKGFGCTC